MNGSFDYLSGNAGSEERFHTVFSVYTGSWVQERQCCLHTYRSNVSYTAAIRSMNRFFASTITALIAITMMKLYR